MFKTELPLVNCWSFEQHLTFEQQYRGLYSEWVCILLVADVFHLAGEKFCLYLEGRGDGQGQQGNLDCDQDLDKQ